jgi:asparagine synthase (glutamine-hydrolysing)
MAGGFFGVMPRLGAGAPPIAPGGLPALVASEDRALWSAALRPALEHGVLAWADPAGVAFHGELYNLPEIARELSLAAGAGADTVLRAGWQRWSTDLLDRLDGVFAIAVRDGSDLVLYRDPSGMRSLYAQIGDDGRLAFATDVQTLLNLPGTRRRLSRRSLHEYLRFLDIAAPHSIYDGVVAPEAGQAYRWSGGALRVVPLPARATGAQHAPATFEKAVEELDACLHRSVERRLAGAARPAAFLSGGVDSALVCAEAARCRDDMFAVTVGFEGAAYDESAMAERVASHLRMRHDILRFDRREYIAAFERLCREMSQPMADPATMARCWHSTSAVTGSIRFWMPRVPTRLPA